jgi:RNA polymerase sigma-70 factor (ECF subfamily)
MLAKDLTQDHDAAEDLTQEVFIRVYRAMNTFRGDSKLSTWIYRVTMNAFINTTRSRQYEVSKTSAEYDDELHNTGGITYEVTDPERLLSQKVIDEHIQEALKKLSPSQRTVFVLRHYHDLPLKEIAEQMGNTEGTVKVLLFRAIQNLQKMLEFYRQDK